MSRFLRRAARPAAEEDTEPLPPATSELITRPSAETKIPPPPEHSAEERAKLEELEAFLRKLHTETLSEEDPYWSWEERWVADKSLYARYLRAAKWDLANAKKRIQGTLEWRRDFKPDLLVPEDVRIEGETGKHVISGFDRLGRVVLYLRPGRENTKPSDRQIRYLVWSLERSIDFLPPGQEKICLVIDYKSATTQNNPSFSTSRRVLDILQNHYVERLGRAYVSSVPWFINAFFSAIQPFLDPVTRDKIRFNAHLPEFIPPEQLDCEWKGGRWNYKFDADIYWSTLLDFCGIAEDGTRTHESYAKTQPSLAQATSASSLPVSPSNAKDTSTAGQTFSTFMQRSERPTEPGEPGASSAAETPAQTTAASSVGASRDASLSTAATSADADADAEAAHSKQNAAV